MNAPRDKLYAERRNQVHPFRFDGHVADVFADMISRSVPSYRPILKMLPTITRNFRMHGHNYYDLGCSLGAGLLAMAEGLKPLADHKPVNASLIGIDNSPAMLEKASSSVPHYEGLRVKFVEEDLVSTPINNAAMVLMNFTLQFIELKERVNVINNIFEGLSVGGAFILSEKVNYDAPDTAKLMTEIHHRYKADQGYSQLEISQKRDAIENVLIPETTDTHINRLRDAGFSIVTPWFQSLQFISILAVK